MSDLISRQAAIEAMSRISDSICEAEAVDALCEVPTIELIRCKECKYRDPEDKKCDCGHSIQWNLPRSDEWFCADAERRGEGWKK